MLVDPVPVRDDPALGGHDGAGVQFNRHLGFLRWGLGTFSRTTSVLGNCNVSQFQMHTVTTYEGCVIRDTF